jgi:hypothetical protein
MCLGDRVRSLGSKARPVQLTYIRVNPMPRQLQRHGQKIYVQVLLDPHRAELLREYAEAAEESFSSCAREMLYAHLAQLDLGAYAHAEGRDKEERGRRQEEMRLARVKKRDELAGLGQDSGH